MKNTINILKGSKVRRCAALAGLVSVMLILSSTVWGTTYYLIGGTSDNPDDSGNRWGNLATSSSLTFSVNLTAYQNTYMSISSDGTVSGISDYSTEGKSFSFDSSIAQIFEKKDFGSYHFIFVKVKTTGTYTISYNGSTTYTLTSGGGGGGGDVTNLPVMRVGKMPTIKSGVGENCDVEFGAYVVHTGCDDITSFTAYYSNNRSFRTDGEYKTKISDPITPPSTPAINTEYPITLTGTEIGEVVDMGQTLYIRVAATNGNGTGKYSDIVAVKYQCNKFVIDESKRYFKACPGEHELLVSDLFVTPVPDECIAGSSDLKIKNGVITWKTDGKATDEYEYTVTAKKTGYVDGVATLTISYTAPGNDLAGGNITGITASPNATTVGAAVSPWSKVSLTAAGTKGGVTKVYWTSDPETAIFSNQQTTASTLFPATADFRAEYVDDAVKYKVTATGYTATCASTTPVTIDIYVKDEGKDPVCE